MKIPNRRELQQDKKILKDFMKICKKCTAEPYYFLVKNATLPSNNPVRFRKNLLE